MGKWPDNEGKAWTGEDEKQLRQLAKANTPTRIIGLKLGRTEAPSIVKIGEERCAQMGRDGGYDTDADASLGWEHHRNLA